MTKKSILRMISLYRSSFTSSSSSSKHLMLLPIDLSRSSSSALMHSSVDTGNADDELPLKQMHSDSHEASKFISKDDHTALVEKYVRAGDLSKAYNFVKSLQEHNSLLPDVQERVESTEKIDIKLFCRIFREILFSGKPVISENYYFDLAGAFMETDDCTYLFRLLKEVSESSIPNKLTVINRIVLAFAESRQIDKVLRILDQMKGCECKPDLITYNTVLDILGRAGKVNEMLRLLSLMKEEGLLLDIITYNTLLNGFKKSGRVDLSIAAYKEMCESGIEPDLLTYTAMIDSFGRAGNLGESLRLFDELKQRQIRPSIYIYRSLIDGLKKSGNLQKAKELWGQMNSSSADLAGPEDFKRNKRYPN